MGKGHKPRPSHPLRGEAPPFDEAALEETSSQREAPKTDAASGSRKEYFREIKLVEDDGPLRVDFVRAHGAEPPPPEMADLRAKIEDVERVVRILFADEPKTRKQIFEMLYMTAWSGTRGVNYDVSIGRENLEEVRNRVADMFPVVREKLWRESIRILLLSSVGLALAVAAAAGRPLFDSASHTFRNLDPAKGFAVVEAALLIPFGAAAGLFIEFVFRVNDDLTYEQLSRINPGRWKARARAANTVLVGYLFALLLGAGFVQAGFGGQQLGDFMQADKPWMSFVVGFVTGFAFPYVRDLIQKVRPASGDQS